MGEGFLIHAMELGIFLAFTYDLFRLFRRVVPHGIFWISVEDLIFWCFCAAEVFLFLQRENHGVLRWFAVLAAAGGIWAYLRLASPPFLKYGSRIMKKLLTGVTRVLRIIGKGVICHGRKIFLWNRCAREKERRKEKEESCISKAHAESREHGAGIDGGTCHRGGDRRECHEPSEEDRCL